MSPSEPNIESLLIRTVLPEDGPYLYKIATHPEVAHALTLLPSMEFSETEQWINKHRSGHHRFVAVKGGRPIGSVSLMQNQRPRLAHSGTLGIMVHPDYWQTGAGSALMKTILELADNWLNLLRIELSVLTGNSAAMHLYHKFGFKLEGTRRQRIFGDGELQDEHIMGRLRPEIPPVGKVSRPTFAKREDVVGISVRPIAPEDAEALHSIVSDPVVAVGLNQVPSLELIDVREKIETGGPGLYRFSAEAQHEDGTRKVVGNVTLHQLQNPRLAHSAGLGISVHRDYWGIGVGHHLMTKVVDMADNWLNLERLELEVYTDNPAAVRLYERYGFEVEGTRRLFGYGGGKWRDAHFMGRLRGEQ